MWITAQSRKRTIDLIFMLGLKQNTDQLALAYTVHWYGCLLRREDGHVLRTLDFKIEDQKKKWRLKRTWKKQHEKEV